ncbi:hypothetical protein O181_001660 [Austropuccinia psidii MF-1]|uniref:Uncharacterized protein n=1 Tax=Austropuccinia psidii MF-1 TaxID=1389203 RepID=A0A9Q3BAZ1_9BASI|nr:hypothetical protein [Austropuccinia psidii MF-1]
MTKNTIHTHKFEGNEPMNDKFTWAKLSQLMEWTHEATQNMMAGLKTLKEGNSFQEKVIKDLSTKPGKEDNPFTPTHGDGPVINTSQQVKEEDKSNKKEPEYLDPWLTLKSIHQDGETISYSEEKGSKKLPEVVNWPRFSGVGEYDHMDIIDYIDELSVDFQKIPEYWITTRLNNKFGGHKKYGTLK